MKKYIVQFADDTIKYIMSAEGIKAVTIDRRHARIFTSKKHAQEAAKYFVKYVLSTEAKAQIIEI